MSIHDDIRYLNHQWDAAKTKGAARRAKEYERLYWIARAAEALETKEKETTLVLRTLLGKSRVNGELRKHTTWLVDEMMAMAHAPYADKEPWSVGEADLIPDSPIHRVAMRLGDYLFGLCWDWGGIPDHYTTSPCGFEFIIGPRGNGERGKDGKTTFALSTQWEDSDYAPTEKYASTLEDAKGLALAYVGEIASHLLHHRVKDASAAKTPAIEWGAGFSADEIRADLGGFECTIKQQRSGFAVTVEWNGGGIMEDIYDTFSGACIGVEEHLRYLADQLAPYAVFAPKKEDEA